MKNIYNYMYACMYALYVGRMLSRALCRVVEILCVHIYQQTKKLSCEDIRKINIFIQVCVKVLKKKSVYIYVYKYV